MLKLSIALLALVGLAIAAPTVQNSLLRTLKSKGAADIMITMTHGSGRDTLKTLHGRSYADRSERLTTIAETLKAAAIANQGEIRDFIQKEKSPSAIVKTFWITNRIIVRSADLQLVEKLMARSDVAEIRQERHFPIEEPIDFSTTAVPLAGEQWGVLEVQAPKAWAAGHNGKGIVVANIDTGVRGTHEALSSNHRKDHGWYDPEGETAAATDNGGHGTHTMGSICGTANGIGVAPGAQWIACKGCGSQSCSEFALLTCAEFVACPTDATGSNADCGKAPNVVSNSWGGGQGDDWYDDAIQTWRDGNIVPLFSQGNSGPYCGSANSPGDSVLAIGVGSTTSGNQVSDFSSVGPTVDGRMKPDIAAPGSNVYSSYNTGNTAYATMSGTSMASPHAAGLAAVYLSQNPNATIKQVEDALKKGAKTDSTGEGCGGVDEDTYPNHHVGHGRIDAVNALGL